MEKQITTIIFDWGGVIAPSNNQVAAQKLAKQYNCNEQELFTELAKDEHIYAECDECSIYYQTIGKRFNIPPEIIKETLNDTHAVPENFALIKQLREKGYEVYLLSNQIKPKTESIKSRHDLSCFNQAFFSNEIQLRKPKPEAFQYVLDKAHKSAEECLFIDDNIENIEAAQALGIHTIHLKALDLLQKELKAKKIL